MNSFRKFLMEIFCFAVVISLFFTCIKSTNVYACCSVGVTCNGVESGVIDGTSGDDCINGDKGQDDIFGRAGEDLLFGDEGQDILWGGCDKDHLDGGPGFDIIHFNSAENDVVPITCCIKRDNDTCSTALRTEPNFLINDNIRPVNSSEFRIDEGSPDYINITVYPGESNLYDLKEIKPATFVTYKFAEKGYSELTGLPLLPDQYEMLGAVGSYTITPHQKDKGVLLLKIPAYTKEDTQSIAAQLFIPDGEGFMLYDNTSYRTTKMVNVEYIRFYDTALIPVQ